MNEALMQICLKNELVSMRKYFFVIIVGRYTIPYPDHEDVVNETILGCLNSLSRFNGLSTFKTWTHSIMLHKIMDYKRRNYCVKFIEMPEQLPNENMILLDDIYFCQILKERILTDRKLLKTKERRVAKLMLQGYRRAEIAKKLHYSLRNVSAYRANVIKKLRGVLQ